MNKKERDEFHIVTLGEKICYSLGDTACNVVYGLCSTLLTFFYTDYVGMSVAVVGMIFLITRLFDGFSDLVMGFITDRTKSKWGKARPWILWMSVPYTLTFIALFLVPAHATVAVQAIYVFVTYNLVNTVVYTALNLPYSTMGSLISRDADSRTSTQAWRMFFGPMGKMAVSVATLPLVSLLGNTQRSWVIVSVIYGVIALVLLLICFFKIEERVVIEAAKTEKVPLGKSLKALFSNKYWAMCLGFWGLAVMMSTVSGTITTYFCKYILGNQNLYSPIYACELITQCLLTLAVPVLAKKTGKKNLIVYGLILVIATQLLWSFFPMSVPVAMICAVLRGAGVAPLWGLVFSMIADACEYGQWKTHVRQDGMIYSAASVGSKIGGGLATAGIGLMMSSVGYDGLLAEQTPQVQTMIKMICMYSPILFCVILLVLCAAYKLDKEYDGIMVELKRRELAGIL